MTSDDTLNRLMDDQISLPEAARLLGKSEKEIESMTENLTYYPSTEKLMEISITQRDAMIRMCNDDK